MAKFQLRLEWRDEFGSRDRALEYLREVWAVIEEMEDDEPPTLEVIDVQLLPGQRPLPKKPEPRIVHPWDEGMRFFPEGHTLYDFETEAIKRDQLLDPESELRQREVFSRVAKELKELDP